MSAVVPFQRILVPVDFSDCSTHALERAAGLAKQLGADLTVLHVYEPPSSLGPGAFDLVVQLPTDERSTLGQFVRSRAGADLERLLADLEKKTQLEVHGRLEMGEPRAAILRVAEAGEHDLVVMGTHGRTGISEFLLGSVSKHIVRASPCPVLTVRNPDVPAAAPRD